MYGNTKLDNSQFVTPDNYKLTRALWFALYAPDTGRHDALRADDVPDVYRRLFDAILNDRLPGDDDAEAIALLDAVTNLKTPHKLRRTLRPLGDIAADFFGQSAADDDDGLDLPGGGDWPGAPGHTCAAKEAVGTALVMRPNETTAARMFNPTWRTCPACYHKRVKRIGRQTRIEIATAGAMRWALFDAADYRKWAGNIRQHRRRTGQDARYRALPQVDGRVFVMSTHGIAGDAVPTEKRALYDLLHAHANTPDNKRASSSRGYGGDYKRLRGQGNEKLKGILLWTDARLETVAQALGGTIQRGRNTFRVQIDQLEAFQKLSNAGIVMRARKGQGTAVQSLLDVTLNAYASGEEELCLMRDSDASGGHIAPQLHPPLNDSPPDEVQIWPIYLP